MQHGAEITLHPGRLKHLGFAALCAGFTAIGVFMIRDEAEWAWFVAIVFGLGLAIFLVQLIPGASYLRLSEDGMFVKTLFRTMNYRWDHIEGFGVAKIGRNNMVCFDLRDDAPGSTRGRRFSAALTGIDAVLPDTYGRSAEELVLLLDAWKRGERRLDV